MGNKNYYQKNKGVQNNVHVSKQKALVVNEENKFVLGSYFSLGLNNFYKTVMLVFIKAGIKVMSDKGHPIYDEEKIGEVLNTLYKSTLNPRPQFESYEKSWLSYFKLNSNQQAKLQKLLFHHFPILGPVMADEAAYKVNNNKKSNVTDTYSMAYGVTLSECLKTLSIIAQGLVDCRNTEVHFDPYIDDWIKQYRVQEDIVRYLIKTLVASRRIDKKRNSIDTEKMEFLTGYTKDPKTDQGRTLQKYISKWGFYPKYDQVVKRDDNGNILYVIKTDKQGNPMKDKNGAPVYQQKKDKKGNFLFNADGSPMYEEQTKMVERSDFFYKIGGETTVEKEKNGKVYSTFTGFGLAYFCAIFLTKPQAKQMLSDIGLFDLSPYPQDLNDIIRDMLSIYRIRLPKGKKLEASDSKVTLALDMLNELRKCPKDLYDVLSPEGQKDFEDKVKRPNERTPEVVKRFRNTDRFPFLAMRYIDETAMFKNIRFQVQLGKLRYKFYSKLCINGEEEIRVLQKEINGFGRLQDIETKRMTDYKELHQASREKSVKIEGEDVFLNLLQFEKDTAESKPYITDSRASYNIHNNRIGLYWGELTVEKEGKTEIIVRPGDYFPSLEHVQNGAAPVEMHTPKAVLSIYELPSLVFYDYLISNLKDKDAKRKTAEDIVIDKYNALQRFLSDVKNGDFKCVEKKNELASKLQDDYGLKLNEIPEKLVKYLASKKININNRRKLLTRNRLGQMLKRAIRRRDGFKNDRSKIGDKENRYGKDSYVDVRHGSLARYLAESFLEWQPSNETGSNKLTGMNFSKLQSELAMFDDVNKCARIKQLLEKAGLLSGSFTHPFLSKVMGKQNHNIEELYKNYLNAEIYHIKSILNITNVDDKAILERRFNLDKIQVDFNYSALPFVKGKARWEERTEENYKQLASRYLAVEGVRASIWLPDGLFAMHILDILRKYYSDNRALQACLVDDRLTNSASYLIRVFFENVLDDHSQPFYCSSKLNDKGNLVPGKYAHYYALFDILNNVKKRNAYVKVPMTVEGINARFSTYAEDEDNEMIYRMAANGKELRDERQNILYKKIIHTEIEKRVDNMTNKERGNHKNIDEAKEALQRKLTHMIGEVKNNEKAIRRYKAQDMVMFLMAERLMNDSQATGEVSKSDKFKLENVCLEDFLSQTVTFEFPFKVGEDTAHITQEMMSLKNLGEFYRLLSDDRLPSLLERLVKIRKEEKKNLKFGYSELMGELASYDRSRSRIFKVIHMLEKYVVSKDGLKDFLHDPEDARFYIRDDKSQDPKRNNFRSLLELLEGGDIHALSEEDRELIISIRNAFSHNHYGIEFEKIAGEEDLNKSTLLYDEKNVDADGKKKNTTNIATLIAKKLEELQTKVEEYK